MILRSVVTEFRTQISRPVFIILSLAFLAFVLYAYIDPTLSAEYRLQHRGELAGGMSITKEMVLRPITGILPGNSINYTSAAISGFGSLVAGVFGALSAGSEYSWKTMRLSLVFSRSRLQLLLVKGLALLAMLVTGYLILIVLGLVASFWAAERLDQPLLFEALSMKSLVAPILATLSDLMLWCSLGFMLALILRSAIAGVVFGLAYIVVEFIAIPFNSSIGVFFPGGAQGIVSYQVFGEPGGSIGFLPYSGSLGIAWSVVAFYILAAIVITVIVFNRQDLR